jgi:2,3-bisphosphoglycerate-independent phosphoglycerate mutase
MNSASSPARRVLTVVMDGVGVSAEKFGNAVAAARTPHLAALARDGLYTTVKAHGTWVGLPSDSDIGNSEVGHNALGAGRIFDQGAKLVQRAIDDGSMFTGATWTEMIRQVCGAKSTLHFIGLLSDGNVHSHETHLHSMIRVAAKNGVRTVRVHTLLDGRDVAEGSSAVYIDRLEKVLSEVKASGCDARIASGGGRMLVTMDRYEADWEMVSRGWNLHVHGIGQAWSSVQAAMKHGQSVSNPSDQYFPAFVIVDDKGPIGKIKDHDGVVFFNFRGDRAVEISRAFTEKSLDKFDRGNVPNVFFAGMMEYDGDLKIPPRHLVAPPAIENTMGEILAKRGVRQFACSETQKYGHVTYFWNGNRSGKFDPKLETWVEIPSDNLSFDLKPWMKAWEICETTIEHMKRGAFDFGRINFANGDMVGHTGNFEAAVIAVSTVDLMIKRLRTAAEETNTILVVTADHGNADEMFDAKAKDFPNWEDLPLNKRPRPKTSHTLNPVPFYVYDPLAPKARALKAGDNFGLANFAATALELMGQTAVQGFEPSLLV